MIIPKCIYPKSVFEKCTRLACLLREALLSKNTVKRPDIVRSWGGGGVNPSSLIKPKFTGSSNHPEMDSRHHNMNAMPQGWLG